MSATPDIETVCTNCKRKFWRKASDRAPKGKGSRCPACRSAETVNQVSTSLATLQQARAQQDAMLARILPDPAKLFEDINRLLGEASTPVHLRKRTFWEWLRDVDIYAQQIEHKLRAGNYADQLLRQRLAAIRQSIELAKSMQEAMQVAIQQHEQRLEAEIRIAKLEAEKLQVEEEAARQQALREERLQTERLREQAKQARLREEINPTPPPLAPEPENPWTAYIRRQREEFQARSQAKQAILSDFLDEVQTVFDADLDASEKAVRIRTILETYKQDLDLLPRRIRELVELVESGEYEQEQGRRG
jgi:hypothetical protein